AIGHVLGWINSRIILGFIFYVMILPIGLIMRLFGRDPMRRRFENRASSYRVQSKNQPNDHLERPF
ncbi:MAG: SxtJ family membrane protein, partial [Nitrososphaera sp.]|nr:SxtJ family membrane protein [Nitrososphaera sp.]